MPVARLMRAATMGVNHATYAHLRQLGIKFGHEKEVLVTQISLAASQVPLRPDLNPDHLVCVQVECPYGLLSFTPGLAFLAL